jgi:WXXGXW repeat (2 copies)
MLMVALLALTPGVSSAFLAVSIVPPALPVYAQPACPGDGYIWTPGYWAWDPNAGDYYWVPGAWVLAPQVGFLWTPGWWGFEDGSYIWHAGYWGPTVGFYGGINYGFGYFGTGFVGGYWAGRTFHYNTAVCRVNTAFVHNTYYNKTVINNRVVYNHIGFNGPNGIKAKPTTEQEVAMREHHVEATAAQRQHELAAMHDPAQRYAANHGHPKKVALTKVGGREEQKATTENKATTERQERTTAVTLGLSVHFNPTTSAPPLMILSVHSTNPISRVASELMLRKCPSSDLMRFIS